jgi:hypothetical protein
VHLLLDAYAKKGNRRVEGWLLPTAIEVIRQLAGLQKELGIRGPVCEIGVHHGRLFLLLHLLTVPPERSVAIDLFEMQDENVDGSGKGSRDALMHNLRTHGCDLSRVELVTENSLRLTPERIVSLCGGQPRLFSIDGGHTAEATRNDLLLADRTVCEGGLVVLDDYFNSSWPGVSEGTCTFMREDRKRLVPVVITSNKFIFAAGQEKAALYRQRWLEKGFDSRGSSAGSQLSSVFGAEVICFEARPGLRDVATQTQLWASIRDTPVGQALRGLKRWM